MKFRECLITLIAFSIFSLHASEQWAVNCETGQGYMFLTKKSAKLIVNSNQVIISTVVKNKENRQMFFLLNEPLDLGAGGMRLNWAHFSKKEPIARAMFINGHMKLLWKGFFDQEKSKFIWISESEFSPPENESGVVLSKCK